MKSIMLIILLTSTTSSPKIPCLLIKPFVSTYGKAAVSDWAKQHGIKEAQIVEVIMRCEKRKHSPVGR